MSDSDAPTLACDLPCRRCRYNLRTLATDARCPECGTRVAVTLGLEPMLAPLVDTPHHRRLVAAGCYGAAVSLPLLLVGQWVAQAYFHNVEIFWKIDAPYLLGPLSLLFSAGVALTCAPFRRADDSPAHQPLRGITIALALSAPLANAMWEIGYAFVPIGYYDSCIGLANGLATGAQLSLALCCVTLAETAREWNLISFTRPLRLTAAAWTAVSLLQIPVSGRRWGSGTPRLVPISVRDMFGRLESPGDLAFGIACASVAVLLLCIGSTLRLSARPVSASHASRPARRHTAGAPQEGAE